MTGVGSFFSLIFWLIYVATFFVALYALIHAARTRPDAFPAADKQSKPLWLGILGAAAFFSVAAVFGAILLNFLVILGLVAGIIYIVDVKPAVSAFGRPGEGPYGPW